MHRQLSWQCSLEQMALASLKKPSLKIVIALLKMGAEIYVSGQTAVVKGVRQLSGAPVRATDLRGGAAMVLAGLAAQGVTEVTQIFHIDRGYEAIETVLSGIGASIQREILE